MSTKRMTANPVKAARYRPGKAVAEPESSEEDSDVDPDTPEERGKVAHAEPPKIKSFPSKAATVAKNLEKVDLSKEQQERRKSIDNAEAERIARAAEDEEFVTEESKSDSSSDSDSESGDESSEEDSSSEEEPPRRLLKPVFIRKGQRKDNEASDDPQDSEKLRDGGEARRKELADEMIQEQIDKDAVARAAGKKDWDDDEVQEVDQVDDTDDLDPDTERAEWKLRELKRVKREREAIEKAEMEREEVERRRNLSKDERDEEDKEFLDAQQAAREGRGKMSYMQKYFHKGAFYQDDEMAEALANRNIMGSRIADDVANRDLLPEYMQIRDMTKLGRRSRTKYKDMKTEDTGTWGQNLRYNDRKERVDERFMPDKGRRENNANLELIGKRQSESRQGYRDHQSSQPRKMEHDSANISRRSRSRSDSPPEGRKRRRLVDDR